MEKINKETCEYLARVVVSDAQIDDRESDLLDSYMKAINATEDLYKCVQLVYSDQTEKKEMGELLHSIRNEHDENNRKEILKIALKIALIDDYFDPKEQEILELSREIWGISIEEYEQLKEDIQADIELYQSQTSEDDEERVHPFFYSRFGNSFINIAEKLSVGKMRRRLHNIRTKLLLSGPEYTKAIQLCGKIARSDYKFVYPILEQSEQAIGLLIKNLQETVNNMKESKEENLDVKQSMLELQQAIQNNLQPLVAEQKQSLLQKKRAMDSYTVSFLGKTKAGKSTLHAVITGTGEDGIGKGRQRTTRFNRVYNWKKIRIIDTPGIGAPGGKSDEEITASIIDQSDMICYVLKNDSIQESEFRFLGRIREKNKPFVILLNLKENLLNEVRFSEFLKDPELMYNRTDEKSIQGHIERIRRYAVQHYQKEFIEIIPVQLLAALMSRMDQYEEHSNVLFEASHVGAFLDTIRLELIDNGALRRSQTILDGTFYTIEKAREVVKNQSKELTNILNKLKDSQKKSMGIIQSNYQKYEDLIQKHITSQFDKLKELVPTFASQYYNNEEHVIEDAWADPSRIYRF